MITGKSLIDGQFTAAGSNTFTAFNPATGDSLQQNFVEAIPEEIDKACVLAAATFDLYAQVSGRGKAAFLQAIAEEILSLGDELIEIAGAETGLPVARLQGERGRTVNQLKLFAQLVAEGSWVNAIIDTAELSRQPAPKPDLRQMQLPLGPVAVFGASNFPFAFSVAGGDTASVLAAGCPVVFKGHPAHPATCELVAMAIAKAAQICGLPAGVFSLVQGRSNAVGAFLVQHPAIKAVGFTGSFAGGKALFDLAVRRPDPIPVYAEMSSVNPVFFLPRILKEKGAELAKNFAASITLGTGQFCTNPGQFVCLKSSESEMFVEETKQALAQISLGPMLTSGIKEAYLSGVNDLAKHAGAQTDKDVKSYLFMVDGQTLKENRSLADEVFGPCSVGIKVSSKEELMQLALSLHGQLTATVHGTAEDLEEYKDLLLVLRQKVGRLVLNGFPTGVEVNHAMVHGGPFPSTTDSRSTSVGATAIYRFTRPVCFQDFPEVLLPSELRDGNPLQIWRRVNGEWVR